MKSPTTTSSSLKNLSLPEPGEPYFDEDAPENLDIDQFTKTLSNIKSKAVRPDLLASIISHYASKWLPELTSDRPVSVSVSSPGSSTAAWLKKRFLVENVIAILPQDHKDSMPCEFLLRLLRAASMVGVGPDRLADLEDQVAYQLDRASLKEVMIPAFSHTCGTLLDVGLVIRLIERFLAMEEARSGAAMVKVAKLVDSYLSEVAMDAGLTVAEFERLATTMPGHARAADDGLYRAVDTYIKAHPNITKQEKWTLSKLIDPRKLTPEATLHAVHSDRLPVRSVIQILFSEQTRLGRANEWTGNSFHGTKSLSPSPALDAPGRCPSKREVLGQQREMRKLQEDVGRLQMQCQALQAQVEKLSSEKKKRGMFRWGNFLFRNGEAAERSVDDYEAATERRTPRTPMEGRKGRMVHGRGTPPKWRNSLS